MGDSGRSRGERGNSSYERLHDSIASRLAAYGIDDVTFTEYFQGLGYDEIYDTNIMGYFKCENTACPKPGWPSNRVAITIRQHVPHVADDDDDDDDGFGYSAVVHHQRCKGCEQVGVLFVNGETYVDRVTYRILKWEGLSPEPPYFGPPKGDEHDVERCLGCASGHCLVGARVAARVF
jgi:hypothetical protein